MVIVLTRGPENVFVVVPSECLVIVVVTVIPFEFVVVVVVGIVDKDCRLLVG